MAKGVVTLVFTDIEGSSALWEVHRQAFAPVLAKHNHLMRTALSQWNGTEVKTEGDAFFLSFARASDAVRFGVEVQQAFNACDWSALLPSYNDLKVRIGMHTGEPFVVDENEVTVDYWGPAPNRAARVSAAGHGGQILISDTVHSLVQKELPADITFEAKGRQKLRGVGEETLWQVCHPNLPSDFPPLKTEGGVTLWNVPFERNEIFTGREDVLATLETALPAGAVAISQSAAIAGLGGIGKTQTAVEFAYRHRDDYDAVLWVGAESEITLVSGFAALATLLGLPEKDAAEQQLAVQAVQRWLIAHQKWLLILDNADDLRMARGFVPNGVRGHVLYTTRSGVTGTIAKKIPLEKLPEDDGARLLLKRAGKPDTEDSPEWDEAKRISAELGGLPLALEQAGAYIEENFLSLTDYLQLYKAEGVRLLEKHGALSNQDHKSVTVTFSLAFEQVATSNPAAADLLRLCAFMAPDDIPEAIFEKGAELEGVLGEVLQSQRLRGELIGEVCRRSLLTRDATDRSLSIHRLVQAVLREEMTADQKHQCVERALLLLNWAFSDVEFENWPLCERLLPHALHCLQFATQLNIESETVAALSNQAAYYLNERAQYAAAEPLYERALAIRETVLGAEHPDTASSLNNLASLYQDQGKLRSAEPLYERALAIRETVLGAEHPKMVLVREDLDYLRREMGQ